MTVSARTESSSASGTSTGSGASSTTVAAFLSGKTGAEAVSAAVGCALVDLARRCLGGVKVLDGVVDGSLGAGDLCEASDSKDVKEHAQTHDVESRRSPSGSLTGLVLLGALLLDDRVRRRPVEDLRVTE